MQLTEKRRFARVCGGKSHNIARRINYLKDMTPEENEEENEPEEITQEIKY